MHTQMARHQGGINVKRITYMDAGKWRMRIGDTEYSGKDVDRIAAIENLLGDDYDLDRLKDLVELAKNIPHVCRFCVGCEMEPKDGHGCDKYDSFVFSTRRLRELVEADRDGRCVVLPQKTVFELTWDAGPGCDLICPISIDGEGQCDFCDHGKLFVYEQECRQEHLDRIGKTIFLTREDAEAAMKGEKDG